jgi:hypothetical protein
MIAIYDLQNKNPSRKFQNSHQGALEALMPYGCTRRYPVKMDLYEKNPKNGFFKSKIDFFDKNTN